MLDERLSLAASLFEPCEVGADIGTDHALLPVRLLQSGVCKRMLLCDVSDKALAHARAAVRRARLENRARLICADGLDALDEACGCVSMMGMGGSTMREILLRGQQRLRGAVLVLGAHTEQPLVRDAVQRIGYRLTREELCKAGGRFYVMWRAEPGEMRQTEEEILYGSLMYESGSPLLREYLLWRMDVMNAKRHGLLSADAERARDELARTEAALAFYRRRLEERA